MVQVALAQNAISVPKKLALKRLFSPKTTKKWSSQHIKKTGAHKKPHK